MTEELSYKLENFEGPLDLLLTLIEKNKVDIYDIPIAEITDQYVQYVENAETEDLDLLSEFLVLASTLIDIKSRMLLPKEEDESGEEIDPRLELALRLKEYREFKEKAGELRNYYDIAEGICFKEETLPEEVKQYKAPIDYDALFRDVTILRLRDVFESILQRNEDKIDEERASFGEIVKDPVRIADKFQSLKSFGKSRKRFSFRELLEKQKSRADIVVTFLACLEFIRIGQLFVRQEETCGEIDLEWNEECNTTLTEEEIEQYE